MKRLISMLLVSTIGVTVVDAAFAARVVRVRRGPHRTTVVVHRGWPLRRALPVVVVRPARVAPRVVAAAYLAPVVFTAVVVSRPAADVIVWEDSETLSKADDWTEFTLNADSRGEKLYLDVVRGRVQVDFAEIVFENGDARVVDFANKTHGPGTYGVLDFADGRKVDHVRVVARARTDEATLSLLMRK